MTRKQNEQRTEGQRQFERRDSGVFERCDAPAPTPDRARVLLCVLGISDRATERAASRALDTLPWTPSARELARRLLRSEDPEAGARAALALARGEGASAFAEVLRHVGRRLDAGPEIDAGEARMLGAALAAADRTRAVAVVRIQVASARSEEQRALWRSMGVGIAKG